MNLRIALLAAASAAACATARPAAATWNCGAMDRAVAESGAELYEGPDGTSKSIAQFRSEQPLCADKDVKGFGFRRVSLADGRAGFVRDTSLTIY